MKPHCKYCGHDMTLTWSGSFDPKDRPHELWDSLRYHCPKCHAEGPCVRNDLSVITSTDEAERFKLSLEHLNTLMRESKTTYEAYETINPTVADIVTRYCGNKPETMTVVLKALANLCFSLGRDVGYNEGHDDAKHGRDSRIKPTDLHLN